MDYKQACRGVICKIYIYLLALSWLLFAWREKLGSSSGNPIAIFWIIERTNSSIPSSTLSLFNQVSTLMLLAICVYHNPNLGWIWVPAKTSLLSNARLFPTVNGCSSSTTGSSVKMLKSWTPRAGSGGGGGGGTTAAAASYCGALLPKASPSIGYDEGTICWMSWDGPFWLVDSRKMCCCCMLSSREDKSVGMMNWLAPSSSHKRSLSQGIVCATALHWALCHVSMILFAQPIKIASKYWEEEGKKRDWTLLFSFSLGLRNHALCMCHFFHAPHSILRLQK